MRALVRSLGSPIVLAGALVGASLALEDTPDPRPLLEKLYRKHVMGQ